MIFWGLKTVALFDVWSIEHVLSGISAGASVQNHHDKKIQKLNPHPPAPQNSFSSRFHRGAFSRVFVGNDRTLFGIGRGGKSCRGLVFRR